MKVLLIIVAFSFFFVPNNHADDNAPVPLHLENNVLIGHGDTINIHNVSVAGADGKAFDIELHLAIQPDGTVLLSNSKTTSAQTAPDPIDPFLPGEYACISGDTSISFTLSGPVTDSSGRHVWIFVGNPGEYYSGSWTTGPAAHHPQLTGLNPRAVFPKGQTIGRFIDGGILLVQQMGDKLLIGRAEDNENPTTHMIDYTLKNYNILKRKPAASN